MSQPASESQHSDCESANPDLVACAFCGKVHRRTAIKPGSIARCLRCNSRLYGRSKYTNDHVLALSLAALFLYVPANIYPLMTINSFGRYSSNHLLSGLLGLWGEGAHAIGVLVFFCSVLAPLLLISAMLVLLLPIWFGVRPPGARWLLRSLEKINPWSMLDVYLLAVFVSFIKLADLAAVTANTGLYCLVGLMLISLYARVNIDMDELWENVRLKLNPRRQL
jgi:paraquat-inducible protein A